MKQLNELSLEELWQIFPIVLKEHQEHYVKWYEAEKQQLSKLVAEFHLVRINQIGSTAVPGLMAKPIVDILLELPEDYDLPAVAKILQAAGWLEMARDREKQTLDLNQGYTPNGFAEKVFHLHIKVSGDWDELYFRDYLRKYPEVAHDYQILKLDLKEKFAHNRDAYTEAKTDFIANATKKARQEFGPRYLPQ